MNVLPIVAGTIVFALLAFSVVFYIYLYRKSQLKMEVERSKFREALLETENEIRIETLKNVSRDLHDNIGQLISVIKLNLNQVQDSDNPKNVKKIEESKDLLKQLILEVKSLSGSLNLGGENSKDIISMIQSDVDRINKTNSFNISFNYEERLPTIEYNTSIFLYRIYQEMINNSMKHSKSAEAELSIFRENGKICFDYTDHGAGYPKNTFDRSSEGYGNGLENLKERCKIINAILETRVEDEMVKGYRVILSKQ